LTDTLVCIDLPKFWKERPDNPKDSLVPQFWYELTATPFSSVDVILLIIPSVLEYDTPNDGIISHFEVTLGLMFKEYIFVFEPFKSGLPVLI
jgi:hypothetical protein